MNDRLLAPNYEPFGKQTEFHRSSKRFKVAAAGNRGGKTLSGAAEFLANIYRDLKAGRGKPAARVGATRVPRLAYWIVTPTHDMGEFPYRELIRFLPLELIDKVNASTREVWLKGDIHIDFKSTERPERLVAASLNGLWMDEACRCKAEAWRGGLRARLADQSGWALFTTSPLGGRNNWVYQELVSKVGIDEHVGSFHWRTEDNPHIPREEIEHARRTQPYAWFKRDWEASWDAFGGGVYEFDEALHVVSEEQLRFEYGLGRRPITDLFNRVIGSIDFGFMAPGCLLAVGEIGDGNWVVVDESYGPGRRPIAGSSVTWLDECKRFAKDYGITYFVGDPEDAGAMFDLRNNGISIRAANKTVYQGIRRVASAMHPRPISGANPKLVRAGLRFLDRCKNSIREHRDYQWKQTKDGSGFLDEPAEGQSDHSCDAMRYAGMELRLYDYVEQQRNGGAGRPIY